MKKFLATILTITIIFTLAGCGDNNSTETITNEPIDESVNVTSENVTSNSDSSLVESVESTDEEAFGKYVSSDEPVELVESEEPSVTSKPSETSKPNITSLPTVTSTPSVTSKPNHTHTFANATCTEPKKCSCGQTKGSALGHKWQEATCKAPKTCSVCKATEGNIAEHKYDKFICTLCGFKDEEGIATATNPRLSFKPKTYTTKYSDDYLTEIGLFVSTITFGETMGWSGDMYWSTEYINSPRFPKDEYKDIMSQEHIVYNSNKYYLYTGSGESCVDWSYELTDKYIIVFDKGQQILKFTLNLDGTLYVVDSKKTSGHLKILVGTTLI
jgi:hypothetical protein